MRIIHKVYPLLEIRVVNVEPIGQRNHVLVVNESIIFKFPRTRHGLDDLRKEATILQRLHGRLPSPVPKPLYDNLEALDPETAFLGYARLPGKPLWPETLLAQSEDVGQAIAQQLAQFLRALHAMATDAFGIDLPTQDTYRWWADFHDRVVEKLFPFMRPEARRLVSEQFEPYLEEPGSLTHVPVLRHGDFGPSNILFDERTSSVSGVIDFGSAGLGDAAVDIASMLGPFGYGEDFVGLVVDGYPELQPSLMRAGFYAGTFALQEGLWGMEHNDKQAFERGIAAYR